MSNGITIDKTLLEDIYAGRYDRINQVGAEGVKALLKQGYVIATDGGDEFRASEDNAGRLKLTPIAKGI